MTADQVIELRKQWASMNYGSFLPDATVLATPDWIAYVQAMADAVPAGEDLMFPDEGEVEWAWPDGVTIVFAQPFPMDHMIVSQDSADSFDIVKVAPHDERQMVAGLAVGRLQPIPSQLEDGTPAGEVPAHPTLWIATDPTDIISGRWLPGSAMHAAPGMSTISASSRVLLSIVTALGHRLTRLDVAAGGRGERRRVERELPGFRMLSLSTGASVEQRGDGTGTVDWSRRWMVRGHWRLQPYGPGRSLRKSRWIDPYVKGPEDKPLDVRQTIWRTNQPKGAS